MEGVTGDCETSRPLANYTLPISLCCIANVPDDPPTACVAITLSTQAFRTEGQVPVLAVVGAAYRTNG